MKVQGEFIARDHVEDLISEYKAVKKMIEERPDDPTKWETILTKEKDLMAVDTAIQALERLL